VSWAVRMCAVVLAVQRHRLAAGDAAQTRRGRYIIPLTIDYEISRELAKAGSYEKEHHNNDEHTGR